MWLRCDMRHVEVVPAGQHMAPDHSSDRALEADTPVSLPDRHTRLRHRVRAIAVTARTGVRSPVFGSGCSAPLHCMHDPLALPL